ncbi:hypothetical protein ACIGH6_17075 [Brachybacterium paraconglomeratum]|uniref:hypothetical protein n=1 Tax=Brachybacterium paraconglomeratum TaxID=173362 RepID=UPI0037CA4F94
MNLNQPPRDLADSAITERQARIAEALTNPSQAPTPRTPTGRAAQALRNLKPQREPATPSARAVRAYLRMNPNTSEEN